MYNIKKTASPNVFEHVKAVARLNPDPRAQAINFEDAQANIITIHPQTRSVEADLFRGQASGALLKYIPVDYSSYVARIATITVADLDIIARWSTRATINIEVVTWPTDAVMSRFYAVRKTHNELRMTRDMNYNFVAGNGSRPAGSFFALRQSA